MDKGISLIFISQPFRATFLKKFGGFLKMSATRRVDAHACALLERRMTTSCDISPTLSYTDESYENAIKLLNGLQSNSATRCLWSKVRKELTEEQMLGDTLRFMERGGLSSAELATLTVIHVAGTKGKGTTCALVESMLREAGLRTGFYSSPHLVSVRERIRINGKALNKENFTKYFFHVYRNLENSKEQGDDMPSYFRFLTCMGFYAFFKENLDVIILEVGIGGRMDPTNVVKKPIVTGITSLGLEHQNVLGNTLEEIAMEKAGIMKPGVPCFTVPTHPENITQLLNERATAVKCPLLLVPPLEAYEEIPYMRMDDGRVTRHNASIALQLATAFIYEKFPERFPSVRDNFVSGQPFSFLRWHLDGLKSCNWHGRFQILERNPELTYFLDGAHTVESLTAARIWFKDKTKTRELATRILVFAITGDRNAEKLLEPFATSGLFDMALFCPLITLSPSLDNWSAIREEDRDLMMLRANNLVSVWKKFYPEGKCLTLASVNHVVEYLDQNPGSKKQDILVTGSLHLIGSLLSLLDPELRASS